MKKNTSDPQANTRFAPTKPVIPDPDPGSMINRSSIFYRFQIKPGMTIPRNPSLTFKTMSTQLILILLTFIFATSLAQAKKLPPRPPSENPHPPMTLKDKARVDFAIQQVKEKLMQKNDKQKVIQDKYGIVTEIRHAHIIPWSFKNFEKNDNKADVSKKEKNIVNTNGMKNITAEPMPVPKLAKDEYMIHIYVKFSNHPHHWYHLDVIVTEDVKDKISFRRFFTIAIPYAPLPPGFVCQLFKIFGEQHA